jgi:hypothetical protein
MAQDEVHGSGIGNNGDNAHAGAAGEKEGIGLENFPDQASPGAAGFPGEIRIVLLRMYRSGRAGALAVGGGHGDSGAIGVSAVKTLAMASRIRDVRRDAVNPLEGIQQNRGCAGLGIGRCIALDPNYAMAWCGIAGLYFGIGVHGYMAPKPAYALGYQGSFEGFGPR